MRRRSNTTNFIKRLFVFVVTLALVGADLVVPAQNANSSTTMQNDNMAMPSNTSGTSMNRSGRRRRRGRRRSSGMNMSNANAACGPMEGNTNAGEMQENANTGAMTSNTGMGGGRRRRRGRRRSNAEIPADMTSTALQNAELERTTGRPEDLSGTYSGDLTMTGGHEMSGPATITISGNDVTLEGQGMTHKGRVTAVTTRGYTGATFYFPDIQDSATSTPLGISVRARHSGNSLTLTPLAGNRNGLSFTSGGGGTGGGGRRRRRGRRAGAPPPPPAETSAPTEPTETAAPAETPGGRRRRGRRRGGNMNANTGAANDNTPSDNMNTPGENTNVTGEPAGNTNTGGRRRRGGRRRSGNMNSNGNMNMGNSNGNTSTPPR